MASAFVPVHSIDDESLRIWAGSIEGEVVPQPIIRFVDNTEPLPSIQFIMAGLPGPMTIGISLEDFKSLDAFRMVGAHQLVCLSDSETNATTFRIQAKVGVS